MGASLVPFNGELPDVPPSVQPNAVAPGLSYPVPRVAADAPKVQHVAATDRLQWGRSIGIALILLIAAAHLGTWTRRLGVAQARSSARGGAARLAQGGTGRKRVSRARQQIARAEARARHRKAPVVLFTHKAGRLRRHVGVLRPGAATFAGLALGKARVARRPVARVKRS